MDETEPDKPRPKAWLVIAGAVLVLVFILALFVAMIAGLVADTIYAVAHAGQGQGRGWFPGWFPTVSLGSLAAVYVVLTVMHHVERGGRPAELQRVLKRLDAGRPFFLFLRPFAIERRLLLAVPMVSGIPYLWALPPVRLMLGLEPNLKRSIDRFSSYVMVAIGDKDGDPGIARLTPTDADWQALFVDLASRAAGIFVIPFTTSGSLWELDWLFDQALGKTVFILPPTHADPITEFVRAHDFADRWRELQERYKDRADLPDYRDSGMMLTLKPSSAPTLSSLGIILRGGAPGQPPIAAPGERWIPHATLPLGQDSLDAAVDGLMDVGRLGGLVVL